MLFRAQQFQETPMWSPKDLMMRWHTSWPLDQLETGRPNLGTSGPGHIVVPATPKVPKGFSMSLGVVRISFVFTGVCTESIGLFRESSGTCSQVTSAYDSELSNNPSQRIVWWNQSLLRAPFKRWLGTGYLDFRYKEQHLGLGKPLLKRANSCFFSNWRSSP